MGSNKTKSSQRLLMSRVKVVNKMEKVGLQARSICSVAIENRLRFLYMRVKGSMCI